MNYYSSDYFKLLQNYYHDKRYTGENIYTYSFALQPFYGHPTGTIDFAKLQTKILEIHGSELENKWITIYASGVSEQVAYEVKVPYKEIKEKAESWLK